jgi:hypothetical protein
MFGGGEGTRTPGLLRAREIRVPLPTASSNMIMALNWEDTVRSCPLASNRIRTFTAQLRPLRGPSDQGQLADEDVPAAAAGLKSPALRRGLPGRPQRAPQGR